MPWKETSAMDEKLRLIGDWLKDEYSSGSSENITR